ncbi:MAG TPA: hypothetical protein ENH14_01580 [candidate division WOR-3 bacterium]|uniref:Uncharacterized protein n=1 Tax=candidate division WOR-3 bacterium TaxID=2052148 RepID=A0A7V0Q775_UNCW3|nr:hypothetical protein [candidate division WOR-3 bacterium]
MAGTHFRNPIYGNGGLFSYGIPQLGGGEPFVWGKDGQTIFVDSGGTGDGSSWDDACSSLYAANSKINSLGDPCLIKVAPGSYSITSTIAVTKPYVWWVAEGWNLPYSRVILDQADDTVLMTVSAAGDGGGFVGFYITIDNSATPVDTFQITDGAIAYAFIGNTFKGDASKACTVIDAEADHPMFISNKFIDCHVAINSAGEFPYVVGNYIQDASAVSGTIGIHISDGDEGEIAYNVINKSGGTNAIGIKLEGTLNFVHHNLFHASLNDPINPGTGNVFAENRTTGAYAADVDGTSTSIDLGAAMNVIVT